MTKLTPSVVVLTFLVSACGGTNTGIKSTEAVGGVTLSYQSYGDWAIGPNVNGKNYSKNVSLESTSDGLFKITMAKNSELHAVVEPVTQVSGTLHFGYSVTGTWHPIEAPGEDAFLSIMFQREGDDWYAKNGTEWYRWYSAQAYPMTDGQHDYSIAFTPDQWISVLGKAGSSNVSRFNDAMANVANLQIVFGRAGAGRGHGVFSPDGGTFTLTSFSAR